MKDLEKDDATSQLRIPILKENIEQIKILTDAAISNKSRIVINSQINITEKNSSDV